MASEKLSHAEKLQAAKKEAQLKRLKAKEGKNLKSYGDFYNEQPSQKVRIADASPAGLTAVTP